MPQLQRGCPGRYVFCVQCGMRLQEVCPNCGAVRPPGARYCRSCGAYLEESSDAPIAPSEEPRCPRCHSINEPTAAFCYSCGLPFDEQPRPYEGNMLRAGRPAGFWIRLVAALIDGLFLALTSLLLSALWPGTTVAEAVTSEDLWTTVDSVSVIVACVVLHSYRIDLVHHHREADRGHLRASAQRFKSRGGARLREISGGTAISPLILCGVSDGRLPLRQARPA